MRFLFNFTLVIMRITDHSDYIFDTCVDTQKTYVPMKFRFTLHNHVDTEGKSLMYLHITQDGKRDRIPLEYLKIERKHWDNKKQRATKLCQNPHFNLLLENIEKKITTIKTTYLLSEQHLTIAYFKEEFLNTFSRTDFIAFMLKMLEELRPQMKNGTYQTQMKAYRRLKNYTEKVLYTEITHSFLEKYKSYLATDGLAATSINAHIAVIKKYLNLAVKRGVKLPLDTTSITIGTTGGNKVNLDGVEVDSLADYFTSRFIKPAHKQPLGLFLLGCFNGFRISDAQQITAENISNGRIIFTSVKTGKRQIVNINLTTESIISYCPEVLNQLHSDQHINRMLKEIQDIVGIRKKMTFHVARHTFATNYLRLGGKVEVLQQILGHSDIKETMTYVHIVQEEQDRGMMILDNLIAGSHFSQLLAS